VNHVTSFIVIFMKRKNSIGTTLEHYIEMGS